MENYSNYINRVFQERKSRNQNYSLRAFARDLGLQPALLSQVLSGDRVLPLKYVDGLIEKLNLNKDEALKFVESCETLKLNFHKLIKVDIAGPTHVLNESLHKKVIEDWEYFAVLNLIKLKEFSSRNIWIAERLNVSLDRINDVVEDLFALGLLIENENGRWERMNVSLQTTHDIPSQSLRTAHRQMLDKAEAALDSVPVEKRFFSGTTMPVSSKQIGVVKDLIREFRERLSKVLETPTSDEVYYLAVQFFPLTETSRTDKESSKERYASA